MSVWAKKSENKNWWEIQVQVLTPDILIGGDP